MSAENPPNYWEILEIPPGSSPLEITAAYYRRAKEAHPDIGFTDLTAKASEEKNERMKLINEAYSELILQVGEHGGNGQIESDIFRNELENFLATYELARFFLHR